METAILANAGSFSSLAVIILLIFFTLFFGSIIYSRRIYDVPIVTPVLLTLTLNVAVLIFRIFTDFYLVFDENAWHNQALTVAEAIVGKSEIGDVDLTSGKEGYAWLVGSLYAIAGPAPLIPIALNILLFTLLVPTFAVITGVAAEEIGFTEGQGVQAVKFAVYFIAITPAIVFWSPRMLREIISMFLISISVMCVMLFLRKKRMYLLVGAIVAVALMVTIRAQVGAALGAGLVMSIVIVWVQKFRGLPAKIVFIVPVFLGLFYMTWSYADSTGNLSVENTTNRNIALADASSAFSGADDIQGADSIMDIVLFNLPRVALGPFPHEINFSSVMILAVFSNLFWLVSLFFASKVFFRRQKFSPNSKISHLDRQSRWRADLVLLTMLITFTVVLSFTAGNYGLVVRMRLMPFVVLIPLGALGFSIFMDRRSTKVSRRRATKFVSPSHHK